MERGVAAKSLSAQQAHISTDERHNNAQILDIETQYVREILSNDGVAVVAGFQGVTAAGDVTTLGRGGSDITAVALAAALRSETCYIYTDVPGVFSTDPRICRNARLLKQMGHEEMLEMASLGAKVLHTRSVYFAMRYAVPLVVLSTFEDEIKPGKNGTWIVSEGELMEQLMVTGITYRKDEAVISVDGLPEGIDALTGLFEGLAKDDIFVDMITQTKISDSRVSVSFTIPDDVSTRALDLVRQLVPVLNAQGVSLSRDIAKVSVVGAGMRYHTGVASRTFRALAQEKIDLQMISTSEIKISVVVPRKYCEVAVRALHQEFIESQPVIAVEAA